MDERAQEVLDLWFPDNGHWETMERHKAFWNERMQGGMDDTIIRNYAGLTEAGARGELDDWADTPRGRLALLIVLDQFPRSLWRETPAAFGQDCKATRLALEGIRIGHYDALQETWEREFYHIALSHCEGPDHLERMDLCVSLVGRHGEVVRDTLGHVPEMSLQQANRVRDVIRRFGRHPHRNPIYGRVSSPEEEAYIATGDFPHVNTVANT